MRPTFNVANDERRLTESLICYDSVSIERHSPETEKYTSRLINKLWMYKLLFVRDLSRFISLAEIARDDFF